MRNAIITIRYLENMKTRLIDDGIESSINDVLEYIREVELHRQDETI